MVVISKINCIHSRNGRIGSGVDHGPADIDAIVAAMFAQEPPLDAASTEI